MACGAVIQLCRRCHCQLIRLPIRHPCAVLSSPSDGQLHSWLLNTPVRFAGHAHWQNVKKVKTEKDDQRQKIINQTVQRLRSAVREGGSTNPGVNTQLARVLQMGKLRDVPNATMMEAIRKLEKKDMKGSQLYIEGRGLMNCQVIVEVYTDRPKRARQQVQHVLKKYGGGIGESGTARPSFNFKGVIYVCNEGDKSLSRDEALEKAIEAGAEDVVDGCDDEDRPALKFICDTKELHVVKKALDENGLETGTARLEFVPHTLTVLEGAALDAASEMRASLEQVEDAVRVFDNIGVADVDTAPTAA